MLINKNKFNIKNITITKLPTIVISYFGIVYLYLKVSPFIDLHKYYRYSDLQ